MEVVEGQGRQKVEEYLDSLLESERVKGVAMDMHEAFCQAVRVCNLQQNPLPLSHRHMFPSLKIRAFTPEQSSRTIASQVRQPPASS